MLKDGALRPANLLAGTDIRVKEQHQAFVSPDGKYYIVRGMEDIAVINVSLKKEIARIEAPHGIGYCWFADARTYYGECDENTMLEITLP
jgi:hypothetical protein